VPELDEGELRVVFPERTACRKFDDPTHGLSHCMKAVDFVVELEDRILFLECKDPDASRARAKDREKFLREFLSGFLDQDLRAKGRDSFLYEWASGRARKPIDYLVLIAAASLDRAALLRRTEALKRAIPCVGPEGRPWRPFIRGCLVLNIAAWNDHFPEWPTRRIS
jgi:hypothetical protein